MSLEIVGHANTIVLPPASSCAPCPSSRTKPPAAMNDPQPSYQNGRAEKLTNMALTALKDAELLDSTQKTDGQTMRIPIEVHVNAGMVLKGSKNKICSGLSKLIKATGSGAAKVKPDMERREESTECEPKRRRASSVGAVSMTDHPFLQSELMYSRSLLRH